MSTRDFKPKGSLAPLKNVASMLRLAERLIERPPHLPGLGVFNGFSGYGKTFAAIYLQNKKNALRVEIGDSWTRLTLIRAILKELGVHDPKGTVPRLTEMAIERLAVPDHPPLLIDEADKAVDKGFIEIIREIHEATQVPIILIGEEELPSKLQRSERTHNRVLEWVAAQPCDLEDTQLLARLFVPDMLRYSEAFLERLRQKSGGRARRITVNLEKAVEWGRVHGSTELDAFPDIEFYTGEPPARGRRAA
ncbi:ATP-binding protein [Bosea sp. (in: a-proteobacteria)]|uniref:AAA family ATPase n=1 Tax=Bosea sp. (in: a-proteobacteria) TaxID=1871050 RepID=UPI001ACE2481|nr:ATP-binding protein [Bosea sp. (in: a-proteobacteria)]MBN9438949.1 ATP-binding protein [Bosea sp. (in: a-proteobacteria)]